MEITFFQNTIKNTILAINLSKNQYHKFFEIKDAHIAKITGLSIFSEGNDNYLFSTSHDKLVKLWKFNEKEYSLIGQR